MQHLVSIVTPTFNSEKFVSESIASVQKQTYKNWEMVIVDDCSTDDTFKIVKKFAADDSRIKVYRLHENAGTGAARNFALSKCNGNYIAFLDSDDLWKPQKLEMQLSFMHKNKLNFTFSDYDCINENGENLNRTVRSPRNLSYRQLFFCNFVGNLTAIYSADYFGKIPISSIRKRQDWMLWLTILKRIKTAKPVPKSLAIYRIRQNSISSSKLNLLQHNYNVYRRFHGFNIAKSTLCMLGFLFMQLCVKPFYVQKST